jgi:hypothetical protein
MNVDKIKLDVAYALAQLGRALRSGSAKAAAADAVERAIDALERVEAELEDPGNAPASDVYLALPPDEDRAFIAGRLAELAAGSEWTAEEILAREG